MRNITVLLLSILFFISCSTRKIIEVPVETIKTEYVSKQVHDSIIIKDSIDRYVKGDTLFIYKQHTKLKYLNKVDTIYKTDTIPKIVKVDIIKEVEVNHIHWYQKALMWIGGILVLLLAGVLIYKLKF